MPWSVFDDIWNLDPAKWNAYGHGRARGRVAPYPAVNVYGSEEKLLVTSHVPGLKTDDLDINVHGRSLVIKGTRPFEEPSERDRKESSRGR